MQPAQAVDVYSQDSPDRPEHFHTAIPRAEELSEYFPSASATVTIYSSEQAFLTSRAPSPTKKHQDCCSQTLYLKGCNDALNLLTEVNGCQISCFTGAQQQQLLCRGKQKELLAQATELCIITKSTFTASVFTQVKAVAQENTPQSDWETQEKEGDLVKAISERLFPLCL